MAVAVHAWQVAELPGAPQSVWVAVALTRTPEGSGSLFVDVIADRSGKMIAQLATPLAWDPGPDARRRGHEYYTPAQNVEVRTSRKSKWLVRTSTFCSHGEICGVCCGKGYTIYSLLPPKPQLLGSLSEHHNGDVGAVWGNSLSICELPSGELALVDSFRAVDSEEGERFSKEEFTQTIHVEKSGHLVEESKKTESGLRDRNGFLTKEEHARYVKTLRASGPGRDEIAHLLWGKHADRNDVMAFKSRSIGEGLSAMRLKQVAERQAKLSKYFDILSGCRAPDVARILAAVAVSNPEVTGSNRSEAWKQVKKHFQEGIVDQTMTLQDALVIDSGKLQRGKVVLPAGTRLFHTFAGWSAIYILPSVAQTWSDEVVGAMLRSRRQARVVILDNPSHNEMIGRRGRLDFRKKFTLGTDNVIVGGELGWKGWVVAKFSRSDHLLWTRTESGVVPLHAIEAKDGSVVVVGNDPGSGIPHGWMVAMYGQDGEIRWTKRIYGALVQASPGQAVIDQDGCVIIIGSMDRQEVPGNGRYEVDSLLLKLSPGGQEMWRRKLDEYPDDLQLQSGPSYQLLYKNGLVVRLDKDGNPVPSDGERAAHRMCSGVSFFREIQVELDEAATLRVSHPCGGERPQSIFGW